MPEYPPSRNRGPGNFASPQEAKTARQMISQGQTSAKKRKIRDEGMRKMARSLFQIGEEVGGSGMTRGSYLNTRHSLGPKGRFVSELTQDGVSMVITDAKFTAAEDVAQEVIPGYNVGVDPRNNNCSQKQFTTRQFIGMGYKSVMRTELSDARSLRIADIGVHCYNQIEAELINQYSEDHTAAVIAAVNAGQPVPAPPAPPTRDEILSAVQYTLLLAPNNRPLAPAARAGVKQDYNNLNGL